MNHHHSEQYEPWSQPQPLSPLMRMLLSGLCLGLVFAFNLTQISGAERATACEINERACRVAAGFGAVQAIEPAGLGELPWNPEASSQVITAASTNAFGALLYDPDLKAIEAEARQALQRGLVIRNALSPYSTTPNDFNAIVRQLDVQAGIAPDQPLSAKVSDLITSTTTLTYDETTTINDLIVSAENDFERARDLYGFLLVYAPESADPQKPIRFRADVDYYQNTSFDSWNGSAKPLCDRIRKPAIDGLAPDPTDPDAPMEMPLPASDPANNPGQVLPPRYDWCDFHARLRQSVREMANLRMIYGQEFKVKALGVNFSSSTTGGNAYVIQELAQLRAARYQFQRAEEKLAEGLDRSLGSGCRISDFYTQTEWRLLADATEQQGNVQYHIASRISYLGLDVAPNTVPSKEERMEQALATQAEAEATFRNNAIDQYMELVGMAGFSGGSGGTQTDSGCSAGERPDGALVADIAARILESQRHARELSDGRNIFGFDIMQVPNRPYKTVGPGSNCDTLGEGAKGLWEEANCLADDAKDQQIYQENKERDFEANQTNLLAAIGTVRSGIDSRIEDVSGCDATDEGDNLASCVSEAIVAIQNCLDNLHLATSVAHQACVAALGGTDAKVALGLLRATFDEYQLVLTEMNQINDRVQLNKDKNATVEKWLNSSGDYQTAADVAQAVVDGVQCIDFGLDSMAASVAACGGSAIAAGTAIGLAGAESTKAEVRIADAEDEEVIQNLLLDQSEKLIESRGIYQTFLAGKAEIQGMIDDLGSDLRERQRQEGWVEASPANDPSVRIERDSARLQLANKLEQAAQVAYLAARRAEYEYGTSLFQHGGFSIADIYRARVAQDIIDFLDNLAGITNNLPGDQDNQITWQQFSPISIREDILGWNDEVVRKELVAGGTTCPAVQDAACAALIDAEQTDRFQEWVPAHVNNNVFQYDFQLSAAPGGVINQKLPTAFTDRWLYKISGFDDPFDENTGVAINLRSEQVDPNLTYRSVELTQSDMVQLRSLKGCTYDYRIVDSGKMLGYTPDASAPVDDLEASFDALVNNHVYPNNVTFNAYTNLFKGYPLAANKWTITVQLASPGNTPGTSIPEKVMDVTQLEDIELIFSITRASSSTNGDGIPDPADCVRMDW